MPKNPTVKYCKYCWQMIDAKLDVCDFCGKPVDDRSKTSQSKSTKIVLDAKEQSDSKNKFTKIQRKLFFLCLFFGIFGVHRFYQKQTRLGILYAFSLGLLFFGVIYDCINILFRPEKFLI